MATIFTSDAHKNPGAWTGGFDNNTNNYLPGMVMMPVPLLHPHKNTSGLCLGLPSGLEGSGSGAGGGSKLPEDENKSGGGGGGGGGGGVGGSGSGGGGGGEPGMEGASSEDQEPSDQPPRKRRFHRHTLRQIQEMEMVFKECPHPDEKQRMQLSRELGLEPRQVKFWFQNRRTQMKAHQERAENSMLRAENERLRSENIAMREALKNATCPHCGGPATLGEMSYDEQQLRIENAHLKDELDRVSSLAAKYLSKPGGGAPHGLSVQTSLPGTSLDPSAAAFGPPSSSALAVTPGPSMLELATRPGGLSQVEKPLVAELAIIAMEELLALAQSREPLWILEENGAKESLNGEEYMQQFSRGLGPTPVGLKSEVTRDTGLVMMNGAALVDTIMDAGRWMDMFSCIISRALTSEVLSTGVGGNWNNALQLMYAEFQVLSPLVPTREAYFLRYCKQHAEGVWAIVDVSVDGLRENPPPQLRNRLRPSGFLIQDMPNGYSKVTILQHMEYDDRQVNNMYRGLVSSGLAFGAKRWLATLQRQCERLAVLLATNISPRDLGVISNATGRRSMLKLAQRMTNNFCAGVSASTVHTWTTLSGSGEDDVRVMTRKSIDNPGEPPGIVLSAATSLWMPVSPQRVFEFLRDDRLRSEWDILSNGGSVQEMAHIAKGHDPGNVISLLRVNALNTSQSNMLILQESSTDESGSLIVYAPVDIPAMNLVMQGGDPAYVALLPSGFAILPEGPRSIGTTPETSSRASSGEPGCLLTVAFQILVSNVPTAKLNLESVTTVNSLISCTVQRIKTALSCET
ncbi:homeobox-leucine zipper protein PROTODERMAL FACTOR 2 [Selaginella moellendorffii]|uniref:homeobox-leucine zipper protein PROTODERMAL FACTOR 2 n=1 Tax=Selaginella moellendorffii TaxID=88036 RepID=UPI000D1C509F|nr:homeobox-leucine zipper protein PROTODERMAL FACTOR 2 [Selaginella moellendorffii]|eukprot:XP_024536343.1 homeobox-leucine zipper protein PROTODERMAL FACTOR 2 [Selaginella moellendorffii]